MSDPTAKDPAPATPAADPLRRKVEALRRWYASAREREFLGHAVATDLGFALDDTGDALPNPAPAGETATPVHYCACGNKAPCCTSDNAAEQCDGCRAAAAPVSPPPALRCPGCVHEGPHAHDPSWPGCAPASPPRQNRARSLAVAAIRWLVDPSPGYGEYECEHGNPVISGTPCAEPDCPGLVVRRALAALQGEDAGEPAPAPATPAHLWEWQPIQALYWCPACRAYAKSSDASHLPPAAPVSPPPATLVCLCGHEYRFHDPGPGGDSDDSCEECDCPCWRERAAAPAPATPGDLGLLVDAYADARCGYSAGAITAKAEAARAAVLAEFQRLRAERDAARAQAFREAARVPGRFVFTEVRGLAGLTLTGAERDDWIVRATGRKVLTAVAEEIRALASRSPGSGGAGGSDQGTGGGR